MGNHQSRWNDANIAQRANDVLDRLLTDEDEKAKEGNAQLDLVQRAAIRTVLRRLAQVERAADSAHDALVG